jgi:hypothetical protein
MYIFLGHPIGTGISEWEIFKLDWLESIENFIGHFNMDTKITLPPAIVEMMAKIMVELVSTLAFSDQRFKE